MRLVIAVLVLACLAWTQEFDVVIANGRVMDPASGLDGVRHSGIRDGKVAAISAEALYGRTVLDAKGLVVAPTQSATMATQSNTQSIRQSQMVGSALSDRK